MLLNVTSLTTVIKTVRAVEIPDTPDHPSLDHSDSPAQLYASLKECTYATEAREKKTSVVYFSNKAHTQKKKIKLKKKIVTILFLNSF